MSWSSHRRCFVTKVVLRNFTEKHPCQSSHRRCFVTKGVLRNFTEKHPCQSSHRRCFVTKAVLRNFTGKHPWQRSHWRCFVTKGVLRNFTKKHPCQRLFFNKESRAQVFSCFTSSCLSEKTVNVPCSSFTNGYIYAFFEYINPKS